MIATKTQHTPGPWKIVGREILEDGSVYPEHIIGGVTELQVCLLEASKSAHAYVYDPVWSKRQKSPMSEANARLIAAAPDLLEALKNLLEAGIDAINAGDWRVDGACDPDVDIARAKTAIAKATGVKGDTA